MKANKLILGTVQLGLNYGINNSLGKPSEKGSFSILGYAQKNGVNTLDTAAAYGNSEELIGKYHLNSEEKFSVITKFHLQEGKEVTEIVDKALNKLCVTSIDTLFFHSFQDYHSNPGILQALSKEVGKGRINQLGVSVYTNNEIEALLPVQEISVIQAPFNLLDNHSKRAEIFQKAKTSGKKVHTRSVFLQGLFFISLDTLPKLLFPLKPELAKIHQIANKSGISIGTLAMNYALSKEYIDGVLIGVDSAEQFKENLKSLDETISYEVFRQIDAIAVQNSYLLNPINWNS